jgi:hypothetical protein
MSDAELKQYFLKHRGDETAFQAYLDRINQRPLRIIVSAGDADFDDIQAAIRQKLDAARKSRSQQFNDELDANDRK